MILWCLRLRIRDRNFTVYVPSTLDLSVHDCMAIADRIAEKENMHTPLTSRDVSIRSAVRMPGMYVGPND